MRRRRIRCGSNSRAGSSSGSTGEPSPAGWQLYDLTRNPFDLGLVGLSQFAPARVLVLIAGIVSDRHNRRVIVDVSQLVEGACAVALYLAWRPIRDHAGVIMFACVGLFGSFTPLFGVSTIIWVSALALALAGAAQDPPSGQG